MKRTPCRTSHDVVVPLSPAAAFRLFTERLASWWPPAWTWSGRALVTIGLEPHEGGLCFELGPHGFRCDWGRVLVWAPPERLVLAWQIGPDREPQPDPHRASIVEIAFLTSPGQDTRVTLEHRDICRHGNGAERYRDELGSVWGWPFVLGAYAAAARQ